MYVPRSLLAPIVLSGVVFVAGVTMMALSFTGIAQADRTGDEGAQATLMCPSQSMDPAAFAAALQSAGFTNDNNAGGEASEEIGDFATNSGTITDSLFSDGGFGDIGMQWRDVSIDAPVTNVNVGEGGNADVHVGDNNEVTVPPGGDTGPAPVDAPAPPVDPAPDPAPAPVVDPGPLPEADPGEAP